jgi:S-adenosylmethionine-dependent methyltransferase
MTDSRTRFDAGAEAWADYNQRPLGRIRHEVTWHNLLPHLPDVVDAARPRCILDVGGGSGEMACKLVQRGYRVWLLDYAPAMLEQARLAAQTLPDEARSRLTLCPMAAEDASQSFPAGSFEAILCHTLIEYLPEPHATLRALTHLLGGGGLLSVSFVNHHAEIFRQVWSHDDPGGALARLERGAFCAKLFDVPGMAYTAREVEGWLADLGLVVAAVCGVRVFADYVPHERLDDAAYFDALLRLEVSVASRPPYNLVARYVQLIANKGIEHERMVT